MSRFLVPFLAVPQDTFNLQPRTDETLKIAGSIAYGEITGSSHTSYGKVYNLNHPSLIPVKEFFEFLQKKSLHYQNYLCRVPIAVYNLPESTRKTILKGFL
jgi:hypothetical protein